MLASRSSNDADDNALREHRTKLRARKQVLSDAWDALQTVKAKYSHMRTDDGLVLAPCRALTSRHGECGSARCAGLPTDTSMRASSRSTGRHPSCSLMGRFVEESSYFELHKSRLYLQPLAEYLALGQPTVSGVSSPSPADTIG